MRAGMIACKNCKHFYWGYSPLCNRLRLNDPISGSISGNARIERSDGGRCGKEASYFAPRFWARVFSSQ